MVFSSIPFLYYFLPAVLIIYFIAPKQLKNAVLLLSSLVFYAWGEPKYVFLMLVSIACGYIFGLLIEKSRSSAKKAKLFLGISVAISLGFLLYFKYTDFFISNFNTATGLSVPLLRLSLPVGISFYTFQLISYSADVYRGLPAQKNPISFGAYIAMFPQLIAGPIVRYSDIEKSLQSRKHSFALCCDGASRFVLGLCKKVLLSDRFAELCAAFRSSGEKSVIFFWLYAIAFTLQIYFDFSGYSDMAIGLGKVLGFEFPENFDHPYASKSITEFWRRWHMTLGSWFRDYVYIPLGGNRRGKARWFFNIFVVWFLTGFWHGADWQFIAWGLMYAALLVAEKLFLLKKLEHTPSFLRHAYVIFFTVLGFVIFNAESISAAFTDIGGLFGIGAAGASSPEAIYYLKSYAPVLIFGIIASTPLFSVLKEKAKSKKRLCIAGKVLLPIALCAGILLCTAYLADGSFSPFLYFRF